jgi:hypothetical protein
MKRLFEALSLLSIFIANLLPENLKFNFRNSSADPRLGPGSPHLITERLWMLSILLHVSQSIPSCRIISHLLTSPYGIPSRISLHPCLSVYTPPFPSRNDIGSIQEEASLVCHTFQPSFNLINYYLPINTFMPF